MADHLLETSGVSRSIYFNKFPWRNKFLFEKIVDIYTYICRKTTIRAKVVRYIIYMIVFSILSLKYPPFSHKNEIGITCILLRRSARSL